MLDKDMLDLLINKTIQYVMKIIKLTKYIKTSYTFTTSYVCRKIL